MEPLECQHENIRILASRQLHKFGIKHKLKRLPSKKPHVPKKRCYGVALSHLETVDVTIRQDVVPVPKVFHDLLDYVEHHMCMEGIFCKEGSKVKERVLVKILNNGYQIPENSSVIDVCAVTKIFIKHIPGRLIPHNLLHWFLDAGRLDANSADALSMCVLLLPLENLYLLVYLMQFFQEVTDQTARNKVTLEALAETLAPCIFYHNVELSLHHQKEIRHLTARITETLIQEAKILGIVPQALLDRLDELHEEHNTRKKCCAWYVRYISVFGRRCHNFFPAVARYFRGLVT